MKKRTRAALVVAATPGIVVTAVRAGAMRSLQRRVSEAVYRQLAKDAVDVEMTLVAGGPGGGGGAAV